MTLYGWGFAEQIAAWFGGRTVEAYSTSQLNLRHAHGERTGKAGDGANRRG